MAAESDLLIVFARAFRAGKVKTRLMPAVGALSHTTDSRDELLSAACKG